MTKTYDCQMAGVPKPDRRKHARGPVDPRVEHLFNGFENAIRNLEHHGREPYWGGYLRGMRQSLAALLRSLPAGDACRMCNGHGLVGYPTGHPAADSQPCPDCNGSGEVPFEVLRGPDVVDDGMRPCDGCAGTGGAPAIPVGFRVSHNPSWEALTDEANALSRWSVERNDAPYCGANRVRMWQGRTLDEAMGKALADLGMPVA